MLLDAHAHLCMKNLAFISDAVTNGYEDDDFKFYCTENEDVLSYQLWYKGTLHTLQLEMPFTNNLEVSDDFESIAKKLTLRLWNKYCRVVDEGTPIADDEICFLLNNKLYITKKETSSITFLKPAGCNFSIDYNARVASRNMLPMSLLGFL